MKRYQQCKYLFSLLLFALLVSAPAVADLQFEESQIFKVGFRPSHITSGDINGDGYIDLVIANMFSDSISIAYNNGQGGFDEISEIPYTQEKKHPTSVATGDLDGDGDLDIATSQIQEILNAQQPFQNVSMVLFYNNGDGSFDQVIFPFDGNPSMSLIRDVNGDGQNDLIIGDNGELSFEAQAVGQFEPGITIYTNAGNRMFDLHKNIVTNGSIVYLNYRDYNQDANLDLVAISQGQITINALFQVVIIDPFIHVFKGTNDGLRDTASFDIEISQDPYTSALADFDQDGKDDLIVSFVGEMDLLEPTGENAFVGIYRNNGESFVQLTTVTIDAIGYQVMPNDFDLDGDIDFSVTAEKVIPLAAGKEYEPYVKFYENDGSNNFTELTVPNEITGQPEPKFLVERLPRYAVSEDLDNDGDVDVAVLCSIKDAAEFGTSAEGKVYVLTNLANTSTISEWMHY